MNKNEATIDLHMHTNNSDGCHTTEEVLKMAENLRKNNEIQLEIIAITDHDDIRAPKEIQKDEKLRSLYGGVIIPGVELSFVYKNGLYDVLGYGINLEVMDAFLNRYSQVEKVQFQQEILEDFKRVCDKNGIIYSKDVSVKKGNKSEAFNELFTDITITHREENKMLLIEGEPFSDRAKFYKKHFSNPKSEFFTDETRHLPTLKECINIIKKSGGVSVLAHSCAYGREKNENLEFIDYAIAEGVDGLEKYYTVHTEEDMAMIDEICKQKGLIITGGTDFHGELVKKGFNMGTGKGNLHITKEHVPYVKELIKKDIGKEEITL